MPNKYSILAILAVSQLLACGGGGGSETVQQTSSAPVTGAPVYISKQIPFAQSVYVSQAVKSECDLNGKLSEFIQAEGRNYGANVVGVDTVAGKQGRVLTVKITNVMGAGGGAWSGAKSVSVEGELSDNGKVIGSFRGSRYSGGGVFGGFKGTCSILGRCVKALGSDIAGWLQSPVMNANLGDGYR